MAEVIGPPAEMLTKGNQYFGKVHCPVERVHENRLRCPGAANDRTRSHVKHDFEELFNPSALDWKEKAIVDADQAFEGVFSAEGYLD